MNRFVKCLMLQTVLYSLAAAQTGVTDLTAGLRLLEEARTTLAEKSLSGARNYFVKLTQESAGNPIYWRELGRVDLYRCNAADMRGDKKAAMGAMDSALDEVQRSIQQDDSSADAHSLLADLYARRIGLGGFMVGAHFGPKVAAENKRALELDGNNPRVLASLGRQYLEAPKMFGGDVAKAIASFQKSTALEPNADETFVWLAIAQRKSGDSAAASKSLDEALRLNPRSVFAQNTKAGK
jgi:tetratricopeptide (TPR) repeat protein